MLPRLLAFLVPATLITTALVAGGFFEPADTWVQPEASVHTTRMKERLAAEPKIVMLGNSQAMSSVDAEAVATALGAPGSIATAGIPGAQAPTIYTALKYAVFGAGHHPKLVLLPMSPAHLLETSAPEGDRLNQLLEHLPAPDPVLNAKVFGRSTHLPGLDRVLARTSGVRDAALAWWTSRLAGVIAGEDPVTAMEAARRDVLGEVAGSNMVQNTQVMPGQAARARAAAVVSDIDKTLVPDLAALCAENGATLMIVSVPQKMASLSTPLELTHQLAVWLHDHGVGFLHLEGAPVPTDSWLDEGHMNARGRDAYTATLTQALAPLHLLDGGPVPDLPLPFPPPAILRSQPVEQPVITALELTANPCVVHLTLTASKLLADTYLSSHGFGFSSPLALTFRGKLLPGHAQLRDDSACMGQMQHTADRILVSLPPGVTDATLADFAVAWTDESPHAQRIGMEATDTSQDVWWVPAQGSLRLTWDEVPDVDATTKLQVLVAETRPQNKGAPQLIVEGHALDLVRWGHLWMAEVPLGEVAAPLTIEVRSSQGGSDLFIRDLFLQRASGPPSVLIGHLGDRPDQQAITGGRDARAAPEWKPATLGAPVPPAGDTLTFSVPAPHTVLTEANLRAALDDNRFVNCTPLEAHREGDSARPISQKVAGTATVRGDLGVEPWSLALRDRRMCSGHVWIQPGEALTFTPRVSKGLLIDADRLHLVAFPFLTGAPASLSLFVGDALVLTTPLSTMGAQDLALPAPIPAWSDGLHLTITAPADGWVAVGGSWLDASAPPAEAWFTRMPAAPEVVAAPTPAAPAPPPRAARVHVQGELPMSLDEVLGTHGIPALGVLPPTGATLSQPETGGLRIEAPATLKPMVCLPPAPAAPVHVRATARFDGGASPVWLDVRWLDAAGKAIKTADNKPVITSIRNDDVADTARPLALDAPLPEGVTPAFAQPCVRRGETDGALEVLSWTVTK